MKKMDSLIKSMVVWLSMWWKTSFKEETAKFFSRISWKFVHSSKTCLL